MRSSSSTAEPPSVTTYAFTASPVYGWSTPTTAHDATAGCSSNTSSTSAGYTLNPDTMMRSLARSTRNNAPSSSTTAMSPVRSQPSSVSTDAVVSGSPRYPLNTFGPLTQ